MIVRSHFLALIMFVRYVGGDGWTCVRICSLVVYIGSIGFELLVMVG